MIFRILFPTPLHQILAILAVILLASTSTVVYLTQNGLKNQDVSPFGNGTFYAEYFYYEGFTHRKKAIWENDIHKISQKFSYLKIGNIFVLNSTEATVYVNEQNISLNPIQIMITTEKIYGVSKFRFVKRNREGTGIILGYEIYRALEELGKVHTLKISLKNNKSNIFSYRGKVIGILSPTPSDEINEGILIVKDNISSLSSLCFPKFVVFSVPPEYSEYTYAIAQDIENHGMPVVLPEKSSNPLFFQTILNIAAIFSDIGLFFIIAAYVIVSKKIWLKELAMATLAGSGLTKVLSWLFLRNIITVFMGIILGTFLGEYFFSKIVATLPPTYYFYFTYSVNGTSILSLNIVVSSIIVIIVTLWIYRYATKKNPINIIREVFYQ